MGTHPIFESDFDCLTDDYRILVTCILKSLRTTRSTFQYGEGGSTSMETSLL